MAELRKVIFNIHLHVVKEHHDVKLGEVIHNLVLKVKSKTKQFLAKKVEANGPQRLHIIFKRHFLYARSNYSQIVRVLDLNF